MKFDLRLLAASSFALVLAACGAPAEEADEPAATTQDVVEPGAASTAAPTDTATPDEAAPEDPAVAAAAEPTPAAAGSPTPGASRTAAATTAPAVAAAPPPMWAVCGACHSVEPGEHGIGPSLAGVFNSRAASKPGFDYSEAMESSGLTWSEANLDRFIEDPRGVVPGTSMVYPGLKNDAQRAAVVEYLKGL